MKNILLVTKRIYNFITKVRFDSSIQKLKKCDVLLFCHDADRGVKLDNKSYSPLIDSLRDDLEKKGLLCQTISHPFSKLTNDLAWGNPVSINRDFLYYYLEIKIKSILKDKKYHPTNLFEKILDITKPNCIITIGSPTGLSIVARNYKIPHFEMLHGIGYAKIPWSWDKLPINEIPQGILSTDKISTKTFSKLGVEVIQIPHPFFKRFIDNTIPEEWRNKHINQISKKEIIITLQWGYAGEYDDYKGILTNGLYPEALEDAVFKTKESIFWRFRFHPVQLNNKKYKNHIKMINKLCLKNKNTEWMNSSTLPLPEILKSCSGHITMHSMSSYEAAYMGIPTLMLSPAFLKDGIHESWFSDLKKRGFITEGKMTVDSIYNWVKSIEPLPPICNVLSDDNSWDNVVEKILGSKLKIA